MVRKDDLLLLLVVFMRGIHALHEEFRCSAESIEEHTILDHDERPVDHDNFHALLGTRDSAIFRHTKCWNEEEVVNFDVL